MSYESHTACWACSGTTKCMSCGGSGKSAGGTMTCHKCGGSGQCTTCTSDYRG